MNDLTCKSISARELGRLLPHALRMLVIVAVGMLVYANSCQGVFLFDDSEHIVNNSAIRQFWPIAAVARSAASRPLLPISLAANYAWGGLDVTGYHVFNIVVHLVAGLALYGLVLHTLRLPSLGNRFETSADGLAFAVALIWLVHPLQTQAVTYIVQRCESMMGMFFLLTMYTYLRGSTVVARQERATGRLADVARLLPPGPADALVASPAMPTTDTCSLAPVLRGEGQGEGHTTNESSTLTLSLSRQRERGQEPTSVAPPYLSQLPCLSPTCCPGGATRCTLQSWSWYTLSFLCYCLGLASKEVMVMVLPVLLIYDRVFLSPSWRAVLRTRGWLYTAFAIPLVLAATVIVPAMFSGGRSTVGFEIQSVTPWEYARSQPGVILHYLRLAFWPYPLCLDYGWPIETRWVVGIILPGSVLLTLLVLSLYNFGRGGVVGFLGLAFFLILAPTSSVMPIQDLCFEHRMYLPLACVVIAFVLLISTALQRLPSPWGWRLGVGTLVCLLVVLGGLTVARNRVYHSAVAMWFDVIQKTRTHRAADNLGRALNNLADELLDAGQNQDGVEILREAVRLNPNMAQIHGNLGRGLCELGQYDEARRYCEEAVQREPTGARYRQQLGLLAVAQQRWEEAERELRGASRLAPSDDVIQTNLGQCLADQRKYPEAIDCFQQVIHRDPHAVDARQRLATTLASAGRLDEAAAQARELTGLSPRDARPHLLLGLIEAQRGVDVSALRHFTWAAELDPQSATAHLQIGNAQRRLGNPGRAARSYEAAVRLDDSLAEAHNNLGGLLAEESPARAVRHFETAVKKNPDFLEARFNLATTLTRLKRYAEAVKQYDEVLRRQPDYAPAKANRDELVSQLAAGKRGTTQP